MMKFCLCFLSLTIITILCEKNWSKVSQVLNKRLKIGAFPGAVLRVSNGTHTLYDESVGSFTKDVSLFGSIAMNNQTIFDIASMTKITATLLGVMYLVQNGSLIVDDLVIKYIPQYGTNGKQKTILKNLLLHNAGLQPDYSGPTPTSKQQVLDWIWNSQLSYPIGTKFIYSDLSFITIAIILERITGQTLNQFVYKFHLDMGMNSTKFLPDKNQWYLIPPTEYSVDRQQIIRGQVHDPTAYLFGGVAGNAGIFSKMDDIQNFMQIHLNKGVNRMGKKFLKEETVVEFYTRVDGLPYENRRALGWDTVPIQQYPPCGNLFSLNSFGHTGFTGTMMWADRDLKIIVILLTNRVHPSSQNKAILQARSAISDEVVKTLKSQD